MKMNKLLTTAVVIMGLASSAAIAGKGEHMKHERGMFGERMSQYLELTPQQQSQIDAIKDAQKQLQPQRGDRAAMKSQFDALTQTTQSFDEEVARELLAAQQAQQAQHLERKVAAMKAKHQIWNILTEEQQQKLLEKQEKRKQRRGEKRDKR